MATKLDEAVEVALRASDEAAEQQDFSASEDDGLSEAKAVMRAALLASMKVLLGEVIGYVDRDGYVWGREEDGKAYFHPYPANLSPVYAPSLGEGE